VHDVAEAYMREHHPDRPYTPPTKYHPIDPEHSQAIAKAYEEMAHTPNDPATKASYEALIDETAKQYQAIKKTGLKIEPIPAGDGRSVRGQPAAGGEGRRGKQSSVVLPDRERIRHGQ
jgi:hypothetical protein